MSAETAFFTVNKQFQPQHQIRFPHTAKEFKNSNKSGHRQGSDKLALKIFHNRMYDGLGRVPCVDVIKYMNRGSTQVVRGNELVLILLP